MSAMQLLGEYGIAGITMKNIAARQSISEPALYKQYRSKHEIIHQMIKEYETYDVQIRATVSQSSLVGKEAILFYIERYAELYENYYQLTTILMSMDLFFYNNEMKTIMNNIQLARRSYLKDLIEIYINNREAEKKCNVDTLLSCIEGILLKEISDWRFDGRVYSLKEKIMIKIDKLL